jgi:hypothetical protein
MAPRSGGNAVMIFVSRWIIKTIAAADEHAAVE